MPFARKPMSPKTACCMQRGPNCFASRAPVHGFTGCGSFQRRLPTGGCANGIPLNSRTPEGWRPVPSSEPDAVFTMSCAENAGLVCVCLVVVLFVGFLVWCFFFRLLC